MAWIPMIEERDARGRLAELYRASRDPQNERVDEILRVHSLDPDGLAAHLEVYRSAMHASRGLRKVDRELIALVVSRENGCHY